MSRRRKENYPPFKKHLMLPLALCGVIIVAGIIMTVTNQTDSGSLHLRNSAKSYWINAETITGPSAIGTGILAALVILYIQFGGKK